MRLKWVCTDDGMFSLLLLLTKFGPICRIHRFPWRKQTRLVGVICCQNVHSVCVFGATLGLTCRLWRLTVPFSRCFVSFNNLNESPQISVRCHHRDFYRSLCLCHICLCCETYPRDQFFCCICCTMPPLGCSRLVDCILTTRLHPGD